MKSVELNKLIESIEDLVKELVYELDSAEIRLDKLRQSTNRVRESFIYVRKSVEDE